MILTTTPNIEGYKILEYKGLVTGETIIGANFIKDFFAGIRDIVGGRSKSYEKVLQEGKETSVREMMQRAQELGANAIVGIDIDYETVGQKMYETHHGMSKLYEVSCEELDFLNDIAKECGVTGSRVMGGGFGGCTINLVKDELYDAFVEKAKAEYKTKFGRLPKVYDVVIADGARKLC